MKWGIYKMISQGHWCEKQVGDIELGAKCRDTVSPREGYDRLFVFAPCE